MNCIRCTIRLARGCWQTMPTFTGVSKRLRTLFACHNDCLLYATQQDPEPDVLLQLEVVVETRWKHSEVVRDLIAETLAGLCQPEYESMVEVELSNV